MLVFLITELIQRYFILLYMWMHSSPICGQQFFGLLHELSLNMHGKRLTYGLVFNRRNVSTQSDFDVYGGTFFYETLFYMNQRLLVLNASNVGSSIYDVLVTTLGSSYLKHRLDIIFSLWFIKIFLAWVFWVQMKQRNLKFFWFFSVQGKFVISISYMK